MRVIVLAVVVIVLLGADSLAPGDSGRLASGLETSPATAAMM